MNNDITDRDIPEEEILKHLPVKSLVRFKSVSKQWKLVIESVYLAKTRLARYPSPTLLVLRSKFSSDHRLRFILLETISKDHSKIFISSYKLPDFDQSIYHHGPDGHGGRRIVGHCNGLVCIYHFGYVYLINPTTRKLRILCPEFLDDCTGRPRPISSNKTPDGSYGMLPIDVGFGKDIVAGTYKVILMYFFGRRHDGDTLLKTEVFKLNSGERRCICCPIRYDQLSKDKTSIFANGSLFWLTFTKLAALDLHTEKFRYVLLPSWYTEYSESINLWSLNDRLCLSDVLQYPNVDVWSLQQEEPSVRWEKILSVNILSMDLLDSNFWKLGLAACHLRPVGQKPSKSPLEQVPEDHYSTVLYTENLVSSV